MYLQDRYVSLLRRNLDVKHNVLYYSSYSNLDKRFEIKRLVIEEETNIDIHLPSSVKVVEVRRSTYNSSDSFVDSELEELYFGKYMFRDPSVKFKKKKLESSFDQVSYMNVDPNIDKITLGPEFYDIYFNEMDPHIFSIEQILKVPPTLKILHMEWSFESSIDFLESSNLEELHLGENYN